MCLLKRKMNYELRLNREHVRFAAHGQEVAETSQTIIGLTDDLTGDVNVLPTISKIQLRVGDYRVLFEVVENRIEFIESGIAANSTKNMKQLNYILNFYRQRQASICFLSYSEYEALQNGSKTLKTCSHSKTR